MIWDGLELGKWRGRPTHQLSPIITTHHTNSEFDVTMDRRKRGVVWCGVVWYSVVLPIDDAKYNARRST